MSICFAVYFDRSSKGFLRGPVLLAAGYPTSSFTRDITSCQGIFVRRHGTIVRDQAHETRLWSVRILGVVLLVRDTLWSVVEDHGPIEGAEVSLRQEWEENEGGNK